jgi:hypothetical protein
MDIVKKPWSPVNTPQLKYIISRDAGGTLLLKSQNTVAAP